MKCYGYTLLKVSQDAPRDIKTRIYKLMNGTTVTVKGRKYKTRGLIDNTNGIKLANSLYAIPAEHISKVIEKLSEKRLDVFVQLINLCTCLCE